MTSGKLFAWDQIWAVVSTMVLTAPLYKYYRHFRKLYILLGLLCGPLSGGAVLFLSLHRPAFYHRHRMDLLTALKIFRASVALVGGFLYARVMAGDERQFVDTPLVFLLLPSWKALLLMMSTLGWALPLRRQAWISMLTLAGALATNPQRCEVEMTDPDKRRAYELVARWVGTGLARALPLELVGKRLNSHIPATDPCMQVLSWAQLTLGFALPLLILDWDRWRRKLEGWPPVRRALEPVMLSPVVLLQYTGLFAVACKVGWQWVELALLRAR